jgi:hypothetical protein
MTAPKQPQDRLQALKDAPATVDFETSQGLLTLPHFAKITGGPLRKARKAQNEMDQFYTLIEELCGDPSPELDLLDKLPVIEQGELFQKWTQGAQLGES